MGGGSEGGLSKGHNFSVFFSGTLPLEPCKLYIHICDLILYVPVLAFDLNNDTILEKLILFQRGMIRFIM